MPCDVWQTWVSIGGGQKEWGHEELQSHCSPRGFLIQRRPTVLAMRLQLWKLRDELPDDHIRFHSNLARHQQLVRGQQIQEVNSRS